MSENTVKLKFKPNDIMNSYNGMRVKFDEFDQIKTVDAEVARSILDRHEFFELIDSRLPPVEEEEDKETVRLKFVYNKHLDTYTHALSGVYFSEFGEIRSVPRKAAKQILETHPDKFKLVGETEVEEEDESKNKTRLALLEALEEGRWLTLPDLADRMNQPWQSFVRELNNMAKGKLVNMKQIDEKKAFILAEQD